MNKFLRILFFLVVVRPVVFIIIGLNIRGKFEVPTKGPAIIVANHNSHLDTMVLMSLFPLKTLNQVHPVAAADYFLKNKLLAWFSQHIIGILPLDRKAVKKGESPLAGCSHALEENKILIIFPEGTRGEPEHLSKFKNGVAWLAEHHPQVPVVPVFLHGLGKALPKGEALLVPFFCDVFVGEGLRWQEQGRQAFTEQIEKFMNQSAEQLPADDWQ